MQLAENLPMTLNSHPPRNAWRDKFRWAVRGLARAVRSERNFRVHLVATVAVIVAGAVLRVKPLEWCLLTLCIAVVLAAEMLNTALEHLARAITQDHSEQIRDALDAAAGAVLVAAIGAALVGATIFFFRLAALSAW
jgi:diacylglycerol kinase